MKAYLHQTRIAPLKMNLIAKLVRNKPVTDALAILRALPKKAAPVLYKVIASAMANAEHNFKQDRNLLSVKSIIVNEGTKLKRGMPVSRGRSHPIIKRTSHVTVELAAVAAPEAPAVAAEAPQKKSAKAAPKKVAKAAPAAPKEEAVAHHSEPSA